MDDILIAGNSKETLKQCVNYMQRLAERDLLISFKPPIFRKNIEGQTFLGYKVMPFHCKLSGRSKKRFRKKLLLYNRLKEKWKWNDNQYVEHILPLLSFAQHADSEKFRRACLAIK